MIWVYNQIYDLVMKISSDSGDQYRRSVEHEYWYYLHEKTRDTSKMS
jgi:hypothetical protein